MTAHHWYNRNNMNLLLHCNLCNIITGIDGCKDTSSDNLSVKVSFCSRSLKGVFELLYNKETWFSLRYEILFLNTWLIQYGIFLSVSFPEQKFRIWPCTAVWIPACLVVHCRLLQGTSNQGLSHQTHVLSVVWLQTEWTLLCLEMLTPLHWIW